MTGTHPTITDELLRRALASLAAGADAGPLVNDVLRETDILPQVQPGFLRRLALPRTALVLIAAALLLVALAGAIAVGSGLIRLPASVERTTNFHRTFEYERPGAFGMDLAEAWDLAGLTDADVATVRQMFPQFVRSQDVIGGWNLERSTVTTGFIVGGRDGDHGVTIAFLDKTPFNFSVWCFGPGNVWSDPPTPQEVLTSYREWAADLAIPDLTPTTLDGYPASSLRTPSGRCPTLHPTERTHVEPDPGVLTLVQLDGSTVAVAIWGESETILEAWLPTATEFVKTIHFITKESE